MSRTGNTKKFLLTENNMEQLLEAAVQAVKEESLLIFPTDTVYGIGGAAFSSPVLQRLTSVKGTRDSKAYALLVANPGIVGDIAGTPLTGAARRLANEFWPGPLTIIWHASPDIQAEYKAANGSLGYRVPNHDFLRALLQAVGGSLWATSANKSGFPAPVEFQEIDNDISQAAALTIDEGERLTGVASTVVDARTEPVKILREGAISADRIHTFLREVSLR